MAIQLKKDMTMNSIKIIHAAGPIVWDTETRNFVRQCVTEPGY